MIAPGTDLHACAELVQRADPERFHAAMAAPVAARAVLFPIYAFNVEVARAPWVTAEPMIAEMRLQWWRDALEEIRAGGAVRRHEVVTPLAQVLDAEGAALLDGVVEARRLDIEKAPFANRGALMAYLAATGGGLMQAAARALGDRDGRAALGLGTASALAAYLRAVPELEARGKLPLPDGRPEAVADLARLGLERLAEARSLRATVVAAARPALLAAAMAAPVLRRAVEDPRRVAEGTLMPSPAAERARWLWVGMTGRW
ncbi:squalene/phytoene synthase family protein [Ponticoccus alexandrii]|uniref:Squalene/phytoene synthase family protein n=1 Tax=Ponticoccus alexandrii TaxID=1943633 RepID=A0ABX7FFQ1_9RHOB|nr:squalene/phytoene synthase family protein [Ponticoccus alexandrii]ETA52658.2 phytoene synthase [Rhodobacteraceae bacterium PD-2]QRF68484.1 squalene/phytoene synthase family protein [Ponticoccus alexandrii]